VGCAGLWCAEKSCAGVSCAGVLNKITSGWLFEAGQTVNSCANVNCHKEAEMIGFGHTIKKQVQQSRKRIFLNPLKNKTQTRQMPAEPIDIRKL
jgi:predicted phosphodiesterase